MPPLMTISSSGWPPSGGRRGRSRAAASRGSPWATAPASQALRACTMKVRQPAPATVAMNRSRSASLSWSSMPMRHLTVTGTRHARPHGRHAVGHQLRLGHQAGAEAALLHAVRRAADIEVDLVVAEPLADRRRLRELRRIAAAQLQRHRMLLGLNASSRSRSPVQDRPRPSPSRCRARTRASAAGGSTGNADPSNPSWARRRSGGLRRSSCLERAGFRGIDTHRFGPTALRNDRVASRRRYFTTSQNCKA